MYCAILSCGNNKGSQNSNVTFHHFPIKKEHKALWIKATGREAHWKPNKSDCICSEHFKRDLFHKRKNKLCLNGWAIPSLKCATSTSMVYSTPKTATQSKNLAISKTEAISIIEQCRKNETEDDEEMDISEEPYNPTTTNPITTFKQSKSTNDPLDDQLAEISFKISIQNRQIKHLLQRQRRYTARLPVLRDQIVNLNKSNETVCTYLENLGYPIASEVLSRIIMCDRNELLDAENPYSEAFEKFIVTLFSLSPAAYNLMRETFPNGVFPDENFVRLNCSILDVGSAEF